MENSPSPTATLRMLFELDRIDDPILYDDLTRFAKGTKRLNRLRLLATRGVLQEQLGVTVARSTMAPTSPSFSLESEGDDVFAQAFDSPSANHRKD